MIVRLTFVIGSTCAIVAAAWRLRGLRPHAALSGARCGVPPALPQPSGRLSEVLRHLPQPEAEVGRPCAHHAGLARSREHAEVWEKVVRKVRTGAMPPADGRGRTSVPPRAS